ncbi:MAG: dTDP-4-dehydrorhamnose 3,5-epimerase [Candidatus Omnitrophica bacterium]|nr:dTDP-4-dehydrorhamnose 3,5-epimerase [Candidatus Omnitrophota bacterium]
MPFKASKIDNFLGLIIIEPKVFSDERGFFMEAYNFCDFKQFGIKDNFVQDNHSRSSKGILRGLHFQHSPRAQSKLVRCIRGEIFDVAVDIRRSSVSYGKWFSIILSEENKKMLYIPEGFAHGFCSLQDGTEIIYKCSSVYSTECERGIIWNDKDINIKWPIDNPILSAKDQNWPLLKEADNNFIYE